MHPLIAGPMIIVGSAICITAIFFNTRDEAADQGTVIVLLFICGAFLILLGAATVRREKS